MTVPTNRTRRLIRVLSPAALFALGIASVSAAEWPAFKPGIWTFERTMTDAGAAPTRVSSTRCTDPTADQRQQQAMLGKSGCQFTPLTHSGKTYRYSATCTMAGMTSKSDSVLEVASAEAYTITVDSVVNGTKSQEVLQARRIGDCKK